MSSTIDISLSRTLRAALLAVAAALAGCNIVGPLGYLAHGPEKVPRVHTLDAKRPTVVFIDDRGSAAGSILPTLAVRRQIGAAADDALLNAGGLDRVISSQDAITIASRERSSSRMKIAEIGRAVGAEVVIFVSMDAFTLSEDGQSHAPVATGRVKAVDALTETRLWPEGMREWHELRVALPTRTGPAPAQTSERAQAQIALAKEFGLAVANLFIKHERRPGEGRTGW